MEKNKIGIRTLAEVVLIFIICIIVYLSNQDPISSGDTVPNTLLVFNLLENHTLHLDAFRASYFVDKGMFYSFAEANNGHLSSTYPIGPALVTLPLYIIFYAYLKLKSVPVDLVSVNFEVYRLLFERLAAAITTAISVVIFYLSSRLKFNRGISLVSTLIFAFATNTWITSSQALWQHGISNLVLVSAIFCFWKANRTCQKTQKIWLILAGIACGLFPGIRPTSTLFLFTAAIYSAFTYRWQSIFFFFGLVSGLPSIAWNLYYFGNFTGGYSKMFPESPYIFTWNNFKTASLGTLISPGRGLFFYSPIVLFSLVGANQVWKLRFGKDEKLMGCIAIASVILISSYCFYKVWWAGHCYGPRFMTDVMPVACYLISYFCVSLGDRQEKLFWIWAFILAIIYSTVTQFVGIFGANPGILWNTNPLNIDYHQYRLWEIRDNPVQRNTNAFLHNRIIKIPKYPAVYIQNLNGLITKIVDEKNQDLNSLFAVKLGDEKFLKAELENTGISRWYGYDFALKQGETRVRGRFFDKNNQLVKEVRLYVSGAPKQHQTAHAIGSISFPEEPGTYKLIFDLVAEGITEFPKNAVNSSHQFIVIVQDNRQFYQEIKLLQSLQFGRVGEVIKIPVLVKNTSNFSWKNKGANPVNLSYHWVGANGEVIVFDGERTHLPGTLPVNGLIQLNATVKFPARPGKYTLVLTMVKEGVTWFNTYPLEIPVEVISHSLF